jgi:phenylalanyl-tRNA synthetase beta chain
MKGMLESLFERLFVSDWAFHPENTVAFDPQTSLRIDLGKSTLGTCGEISHSLLESWDITERIFGFEIFVGVLDQTVPRRTKYESIPKFPPIKRDLAVTVGEEVAVGDLESCITRNGGDLLSSIGLFDLYQGKQIPAGKKSVAFSLTFSDPDRTLKEEEVDPIISVILEKLKSSFKAELRS